MTFTRTLVTGASGFIGSQLVATLARADVEVIAVTRSGVPITGAAKTFKTLEEGLALAPDIVYHLAGLAHDNVSEPGAVLTEVNVEQTLAVFRRCIEARVDRFVWLSSIKVLGESSAVPLKTDAPLQPVGAYAASKADAERALAAFLDETPEVRGRLAIVRPPLVYGPGVKANFATLVRWTLAGRPLPFATCHALRAWISLDNLIAFLIKLGQANHLPHVIWHVRDAKESSVREMILDIAQAGGVHARLFPFPLGALRGILHIVGQGALADRLLAPLQVDLSETEAALDWRPKCDRAETLAEIIEEQRQS